MALYQTTGQTAYLNKMVTWGAAGNWMPADGNLVSTNADNQCCCQTYCEAYLANPVAANTKYYQTWKNDWDTTMYNVKPQGRVLWSWEDALFMAPPAVSMLGAITGDTRYFDTLSAYWWDVAAMLYDTAYHLYFRDASKVNGAYNNQPVFWSRGCGWVAAGSARVLKYMPKDYSGRPAHEKQFKDLCAAILKCQGADGLWRSNLLSPSQYPDPEMSGTSLYCYAFAWGVNNGILDAAAFTAAAKKAWSGMVKYVKPDGSLSNVQDVGGAPGPLGATTQPYAEGAFMLAGTEMKKLVSGVGTKQNLQDSRSSVMHESTRVLIAIGRVAESTWFSTSASIFEVFDLSGKRLFHGRDVKKFFARMAESEKPLVVRFTAE
jgi:rhamnogalacturonyl hydrolase YesR